MTRSTIELFAACLLALGILLAIGARADEVKPPLDVHADVKPAPPAALPPAVSTAPAKPPDAPPAKPTPPLPAAACYMAACSRVANPGEAAQYRAWCAEGYVSTVLPLDLNNGLSLIACACCPQNERK